MKRNRRDLSFTMDELLVQKGGVGSGHQEYEGKAHFHSAACNNFWCPHLVGTLACKAAHMSRLDVCIGGSVLN